MPWWSFLTRKQKSHDLPDNSSFIEVAQSTIDLAKSIAEALRERLNDYIRQIDTTANLLPDALLVIDNAGKIQSFNHAAETIFGWKTEDIISCPATILFVDKSHQVMPIEKLMQFLHDGQQCHRDGRSNTSDVIFGKKNNDRTFYIDAMVSTFNRYNGDLWTIVIVRDVSPYLWLQKELSASEIHYRTIFEMSTDGIGIFHHGNLVECNEAWQTIFGCFSYNINDFIHHDYVDKVAFCLNSHLGFDDTKYDIDACTKTGKPIVLRIVPAQTANGSCASIITVNAI